MAILIVNAGANEGHRPPFEVDGGRTSHAFERPERVACLLDGVAKLPGVTIVPVKSVLPADLGAIHDPAYLAFLQDACRSMGSDPVFPSVFADRRFAKADTLTHRIGRHCFDTYTPLLAGTFDAALLMASAAQEAAESLVKGARFAYALGRPPGHHAEWNRFGGYSYLNGTALAAHTLSKSGPVAVLDVDVHHGNGTQDIFYERGDVTVASIHGSPEHLFPYFSGFTDETGTGLGLGANRNFPLPAATGDREYQPALASAIEGLERAKPAFLVVALGFDAHEHDPIGGFRLTTEYFAEIARTIAQFNRPTVFVQEGGYSLDHLAECSRSFFGALPQ